MKIFIIFVLLLILSFNRISAQINEVITDNDTVKLTLSTNKKEYLEGEFIWFELDVIFNKNIKLDRCPILHPRADMHLELINSKNENLLVRGFYNNHDEKIYPDTMYCIENLSWVFGKTEHLLSYITYPILSITGNLPTENYYLNVSLDLEINGRKITTPIHTIHFEILKPTGIEAVAYTII